MMYCKSILTQGEIEKLELLDFLSYKMEGLNLALGELKVSASAHDQRLYCDLKIELNEYEVMYNTLNSEGVQHTKVEVQQ